MSIGKKNYNCEKNEKRLFHYGTLLYLLCRKQNFFQFKKKCLTYFVYLINSFFFQYIYFVINLLFIFFS